MSAGAVLSALACVALQPAAVELLQATACCDPDIEQAHALAHGSGCRSASTGSRGPHNSSLQLLSWSSCHPAPTPQAAAGTRQGPQLQQWGPDNAPCPAERIRALLLPTAHWCVVHVACRARLIAANKAEAATSAFAPATTTTPATPASTPAADLPDHWAHELPWPEKGCVLVAHPSLFVDRQTYFQQAVILLLDHGPNGSYGVILNKPTQYTMGQIKSSVAQLLSSFAGNRLYMGGDVGETAMAVVTRRPGILGSTEVAAGLYHHTVHAAQQAVEQGLAAPSDFRFFAQVGAGGGGMRWRPGSKGFRSRARQQAWTAAVE